MIRRLACLAVLLMGCSVREPDLPVTLTAGHVEDEPPRKHIVLHSDESFSTSHRAILREAADKWRRASRGRIDIELAFDFDLGSKYDMNRHMKARHHVVFFVSSGHPMVREFDEAQEGRKALALTTLMNDGTYHVMLVADRLRGEHFETVAAHEFGHVVGFPDLPTHGAVMSAVQFTGEVVPLDITGEDRELCRAFRYCD